MPFDVIGNGLLARAFASASVTSPDATICAAGVADSQSSDVVAFRREQSILRDLAHRARAGDSVLVYFSGAPVYGDATGLRVETSQATPETPYGRHKLECESLVADSGARFLVLRLPNVVGPSGHPNQLIPSLVAQTLSGSVVIRTDATRDLLDVDDLVTIVAALLRRGVCNSVLNVASGVSTPVPRLVDVIAETLGTSPSVVSAERGDSQQFSTTKVRGLLPEYPRFEADYPVNVLRRRVPEIARTLRDGEPR
ncbi:MAG: NAD-dependent epimerase/dehydratase family protein [Chloroflexi bacterium]|nr:NAD-dependent epimerase/dehydratase family protein [Chloroflexota bacterium]